MFDKLVDVIVLIWQRILPFVVIDQFEAGVLLRLGKPHKDLEPGFHWLWPCFDQVLQTNTVPYLHDLPTQSVGRFVFRAVVTYRVTDARKFLLGVEDGRSALEDAALGSLAHHCQPDRDKHIALALKDIRARVKHWGIKVDRLAFADHTETRTYRIMK